MVHQPLPQAQSLFPGPSAFGPKLTVHSPPHPITTVPRGQGKPVARASRARVARTRPAVERRSSGDLV